MPSVEEAFAGNSPLGADLRAGIDSISQQQDITFTKYVKLILPLDGYVFWVKADLVSASALFNASLFNGVPFNKNRKLITAAPKIIAKGSFHYSTELAQDETENYAINRIIFTSEQEVDEFNEIGANVLYIAEFDGVRFAFSSRGLLYRPQAGIFHYSGFAVYSDMSTQIIDSLAGFDSRNVIVSNSLPIWLSLNNYRPPVPGFGNSIPVYPSFLVPGNLHPPFIAVHIDPASTVAIAGAPFLDRRMSHSQLVMDRVRITMYGTRNFNALDFVDCVNQFSLDTDLIGIMNMPVIRDEKRTQSELSTIAMKKSIEFDVNYYQSRANDVARQLIENAIINLVVGDLTVA